MACRPVRPVLITMTDKLEKNYKGNPKRICLEPRSTTLTKLVTNKSVRSRMNGVLNHEPRLSHGDLLLDLERELPLSEFQAVFVSHD
jgi:hypothetical protein